MSLKYFFVFVRNSVRNMHYRNKLLVCFLLITICPVSIAGLFLNIRIMKIMEEETKHSTHLTLEQAKINISKRIHQIENVSNLIINLKEIQDIVRSSYNKNYYNQLEDYKALKKNILDIQNNFDIFRIRIFINNKTVFTDEDINIFHIDKLKNISAINEMEYEGSEILWSRTYLQEYEFQNMFYVFSAVRILKNVNEHDDMIALFAIDIKEDEISKILDKITLGAGEDTFVIDSKGYIVTSNNKDLLGKVWNVPFIKNIMDLRDGDFTYNDKLYIVKDISMTDWKIIYAIPLSYINEKIIGIIYFFIFILSICTIMTVIIGFLFSKSLTRRINYLSTKIKNFIIKGQYSDEIAVIENASISGDEIDILINTYNNMAERIISLVDEMYLVKLEEKEAQLKALQSQINPHFLYNVLDSIKSCLESNRSKDAIDMIISLAVFFRIALSKGADSITIMEELEMVTQYLFLQKMHYDNKFDWLIEIDDNIKCFIIPKFTLQPIVENALLHGIKNMTGKGLIIIKGRFEEDNILFEISDDGVGVAPDILSELTKTFSEGKYTLGRGFGLRNVNARLRLNFGEPYGLQIINSPQGGCIVRILIPQRI